LARRFSTLILLGAPTGVDTEKLAGVIDSRFPTLGETHAPGHLAGADMSALQVGDRLLVIERVDTPIEHDPLAAPVQPERPWDPAGALGTHAAHLRIAEADVPESLGDARAGAGLVTAVAGILARMTGALALYFPQAGSFVGPEGALQLTSMVTAGVSPLEAWSSFYVIGSGADSETGSHGALTLGLAPVLGREIELAPLAISRKRAVERAYRAAWQALDADPPLADQATLTDFEGHEIATVRLVPEWLRTGVPALVLVAPDSVVDQRRLRLKRGVSPKVLRPAARQEKEMDDAAGA